MNSSVHKSLSDPQSRVVNANRFGEMTEILSDDLESFFEICRILIFSSHQSIACMERQTKIPSRVIRRFRELSGHSLLDRTAKAISQCGIHVAIRAPLGLWVVAIAGKNVLSQEMINDVSLQNSISSNSSTSEIHGESHEVMGTLLRQAFAQSNHQLRVCGLGPRLMIRLRQGKLPAGMVQIFKLLAATENRVMIVDHLGIVHHPLELPVQSLPKHQQKRPGKPRTTFHADTTPGKSRLDKRTILDLYQDRGMDYKSIADIAGISSERVRQILQLFGATPARMRQTTLRSASFRLNRFFARTQSLKATDFSL